MTDLSALEDLKAITQARYEQCRQSFAKLVAEETRIRAELARLRDMEQATRDGSADAIPMRAVGADMIWQGWIGRTSAALNMQLARVLAVKEDHLKEVRHAYGKVLVTTELHEELITQLKRTRLAKALSEAIEQAVLHQ